MNATFTGIPRALLAFSARWALGLLLSVQGCSTTAAAGTRCGAHPGQRAGRSSTLRNRGERRPANHDELLALSLLTGSQYSITRPRRGRQRHQ